MSNLLAQKITLPDPGGSGVKTLEGFPSFKFANLAEVISRAIPFVFAFAGIGLLLMLLNGGFTLLTSAGDPKKLESGKQTLTYALVGFLIIFVAYWLVQILGRIFGLTEIGTIFQ